MCRQTMVKPDMRALPGRLLLSLGLLTACSLSQPRTSARSPAAIDSTKSPTREALGNNSSPNTSIYEPGELRYNYRLRSAVHSSIGDSSNRLDSTRTTAVVRVVFAQNAKRDSIVATVRTDSILATLTNSLTTISLPSQLHTFTIDVKNGYIRSDGSNSNAAIPCLDSDSSSSSLSPYGSELIFPIPSGKSTVWNDSSEVRTCRAGVLLTIRRHALYQATQLSESLVQIVRNTDVVVTGDGRQWDQHVSTSGSGISTDTLLLSRIPYRVQHITVRAQLKLQFRSALRTQGFEQTIVTDISAIP
jgi:hypothetical protein